LEGIIIYAKYPYQTNLLSLLRHATPSFKVDKNTNQGYSQELLVVSGLGA